MTWAAAAGRDGRSPVTLAGAHLGTHRWLVNNLAGAQCP